MSSKIIAAVDDMFFASKIGAVAQHLGLTVQFVKSVTAALEAAREEKPTLIIADLHSTRCQPLDLARSIKTDEQLSSIPIIGFFSHVDTALQTAAIDAGFDRVVPRSAFSNKLPQILAGEF